MFGLIFHSFYQNRFIDDRVGIRHGSDAGNATGGCSLGTCYNRFLGTLTRLAQMDMHIDKSWSYDETGCIVYFRPIGRKIFTYSFDFTIFNENIAYFILIYGRINHSAAFNE